MQSGVSRRSASGRAQALNKEIIFLSSPLEDADGKLLSRMISRTEDPDTGALLKRESFTTIWIQEGLDVLTPEVEKRIRELKPSALVAFGDTAFHCLTGNYDIPHLRGYVFDSKFGSVVGTYAPDYIRKGKLPLARVFQMDLQRALKVARGESFALEKHYTLIPSYKEAFDFLGAWRAAGRPPLAFDIETPWSKIEKDTMVGDLTQEDDASYTILRISFAFRPGEAITMPWLPPFISVAMHLLGDPGDKIVWNRHFDVPRLVAQGVEFGGRTIDGMDAWHFLEPSLPMGLKYCATFFCPDMHAWKLESKDRPEWYSCADSDVLLRCFEGIKVRLIKAGKWAIFERHFVELTQVLGAMSRRGVLVDPALRKVRYDDFLEKYETIKQQLQPHITVDLKKKKIYKKTREWLEERGKWDEARILPVYVLEWRRKPKPPKSPKEKKAPKPKKVKEPSSSLKGRRRKLNPAGTVENPQKGSTPTLGLPDPFILKRLS